MLMYILHIENLFKVTTGKLLYSTSRNVRTASIQKSLISDFKSFPSTMLQTEGHIWSQFLNSYDIYSFIHSLCILLIHTRSVQPTGYRTCHNANIIQTYNNYILYTFIIIPTKHKNQKHNIPNSLICIQYLYFITYSIDLYRCGTGHLYVSILDIQVYI